jgi:biopolymer transport protein ExbD
MRFRTHNHKRSRLGAALDLTPIVDTVFNLLIFFAVSLNFAATSGGINVKLPEARTAEPIKTEELTVNLTRDGKTYLNDKEVTMSELEKRLKENPKKDSIVVIRADDEVNHGRVVRAMDIAKSSGFSRLAIAVKQPPGENR